jgi:hypothetical protein
MLAQTGAAPPGGPQRSFHISRSHLFSTSRGAEWLLWDREDRHGNCPAGKMAPCFTRLASKPSRDSYLRRSLNIT